MVMQLLLFLLLLIPSSISTGLIPEPGCLDRCGNVTIPYPFGIGPGCSLDPQFDLACNYSLTTPKPYMVTRRYGDLEIVEINRSQIRVRFETLLHSTCYNESEDAGRSRGISFFDSPYVFSDENWLTALGCGDLLIAFSSDDDDYAAEYQTYGSSCVTYCSQKLNSSDGFCPGNDAGYPPGNGCCVTPFPKGITAVNSQIRDIGDSSDFINDEKKLCSYVFVQEKPSPNDQSKFSYPLSYLSNRSEFSEEDKYYGWKWKTRSPPIVKLEWRINGAKNCSHAKKNSTTYACRDNSDCMDYDASVGGYFCLCRNGYEGNPYIGCQDIDECGESGSSPCDSDSICKNNAGSYSCLCPKGYHGDGRRYGNGCIPSKIINISIGVGSGLGFFLLFSICLSLIKAYQKRNNKLRKRKFFKKNGGLLLLHQQTSTNEGTIGKTKLFHAEELEKAADNFNESLIIGKGGQRTVYKGMLSDGRNVAIKKSKLVDKDHLHQFINEVSILSHINHRNVVKLLGCCLETEVPLLVYEFLPNGTLYDLIHDPRVEFPVSWNMRLKIASDIAGALAYLHSSSSTPIYHRDIKSRNILLDEKYVVKISDFGISKSVEMDQTHLTTGVKGTFGYFDPEYFQSNQFTEKSDVYSFGVVLVELLTGQKPICNEREEHEKSLVTRFLASIEDNNIDAILDPHVLEGGGKEDVSVIVFLAQRCLNLQGRMRPTMKEVATELEGLRMSQMPTTIINDYSEEAKFFGAKSMMISDMEYTWTTDMSDVATPSSEIHPFRVENV